MIELDRTIWERLYREVLMLALRITRTRNQAQEATQADRAREATQRAFERYLRSQPPDVDSIESLRRYLVGALRSELGNALREQTSRMRGEHAWLVEEATLDGDAAVSAETMQLEKAEAERRRLRAARAIERLDVELAGDPIALGTVECIKRGQEKPEEQARILGCTIQEIHAARKRRRRVLTRILAEVDREGEPGATAPRGRGKEGA